MYRGMVVRARVRGVYATALSKILNDHGVELVDVSEVIAARLGIDTRRGLPADATVKTDDADPSQILVLGFPESVNYITEVIENEVPYVITFKPEIGLYSAFKAVVKRRSGGECFVETPLGDAVLVDTDECSEGSEIPVSVVKVPIRPHEKLVVSGRVRVVGKYAIVSYGSGVSFSSFIRNKDRIAELLSISAKYLREGYGIRWRSNADEAPLDDIVSELPNLVKELEELKKKLDDAEPLKVIYDGEYVRLIGLTYPAKVYLDRIREEVTPTTPYHHLLRSCDSPQVNGLVDLLDMISEFINKSKLEAVIRKWICRRLIDKREVILNHKRLTGRDVILGRGKVESFDADEDKAKLVVRRSIKSRGTYDGLGIKKEVGDVAYTEVVEGRWFIIHRYYSRDGKLKGIYININTPPELLPTGSITYIDLGTDIVNDGSGCKLIESSDFRKLIERELINGDVIRAVASSLNEILNNACLKSGEP